MSIDATEQWLTQWVRKQPGRHWPRDPGVHVKADQRSWHQGAQWWYDGRAWWLKLCTSGLLFGDAWSLGLLQCVPPEHMPLVTRDLGDRWVVQLVVEGREVRVVHEQCGQAVGLALREAYGE